jgi:C1A family cysteine protease
MVPQNQTPSPHQLRQQPEQNHLFMASRKKIKRILNCVPSRNQEKDWRFEHAVAALQSKRASSIPNAKDLREDWWRIGDQGSTGSCVGWASADSLLRWHFVKARKIGLATTLSVRFQWMASKEVDEFVSTATTFLEDAGTSIKAALDIARKFGAVEESVLPFNGKLSKLDERVFYSKAARLKIGSYYNLMGGNKLSNFRNWIAKQGPIAAALNCDSAWYNIGRSGQLETYGKASPEDGHAISIVGYTKDHFIIRNSWGKSWGDKGFAYASNEYVQAAISEAYGIMV